jgi:site-specific DNA-cytosine methylase
VIEDLREQGVHAWASHEYGDERNELLYNYVMFLDALQPDAFLFENVAHFESSLRTPSGTVNAAVALQEAINDLTSQDIHYSVESTVERAVQHAIPQDRERYIMVGFRQEIGRTEGNLQFFEGLERLEEQLPLRAALSGLGTPGVFQQGSEVGCKTGHRSRAFTLIDPQMPELERRYIKWIRQPSPGTFSAPDTVDAHIVRKPRADDRALYRFLGPGMRWMDYKFSGLPTTDKLKKLLTAMRDALPLLPHAQSKELAASLGKLLEQMDDSLLLRLLLEATSGTEDGGHHLLKEGYLAKGPDHHGDWLERLSPHRPSKTIVAHIGKDTYGYIHPTEPRAISIREAARIQSFPDFFEFGGVGVVDAYSMIGNAVPPLLAAAFAARFNALNNDLHLFRLDTHDVSHGAEEPQRLSVLG